MPIKVGLYAVSSYTLLSSMLNSFFNLRIFQDKIEIMEIVPDQPGAWRENQATIALSE
jgi:hypothetical protein